MELESIPLVNPELSQPIEHNQKDQKDQNNFKEEDGTEIIVDEEGSPSLNLSTYETPNAIRTKR
eukprot:gnl/Chilomastix_caulleri/8320.p2 GENE.gnl/Chilomastix_caulleri/8320~~gnl/Chilomastix_caulleri/8320.p2  ORF type:complete len:64 (+),score=14.49 gnl/Chilomastix_caulleri/8320:76-267(+)